MIVNDFNIRRHAGLPPEADSQLIVHTDAVLAFPVPRKLFETITRRRSEVLNQIGSLYQIEFTLGKLLNGQREPLDSLSVEYPLGILVTKGFDHKRNINASRY